MIFLCKYGTLCYIIGFHGYIMVKKWFEMIYYRRVDCIKIIFTHEISFSHYQVQSKNDMPVASVAHLRF